MTRSQALAGAVVVGVVLAVVALTSQSRGGRSEGHPVRHRAFPAAAHANVVRGESHVSHAKARHRRHRARRRARQRHYDHRPQPVSASGLAASSCDYRDPESSGCGAIPPAGSCHLRDHRALQDPRCTPGAVDPRVTQANIHSTICVSGYTDTVRPPTSYTSPLESELIRAYGLSISPSQSELDHLVSLELGGAPADPRNLFPEPYRGRRGATDKDALENRLHAEVCSDSISLARAQREIVDWVKYQPPSSSSPGPSGSSASGSNAPSGGGCDPNYSGACLDPSASDYDCAGGGGDGPKYVNGPIRVVGTDTFDLDSDGDGIACE